MKKTIFCIVFIILISLFQTNRENLSSISKVDITTSGEVYVHGLGNYSEYDVKTIIRGVSKFYNLKCYYSDPYPLDNYFYDSEKKIIYGRIFLRTLISEKNYHIFVTNDGLCEDQFKTELISGHGFINGKISVISTKQMYRNNHYNEQNLINTANHELGHNFGLRHCSDSECLMTAKGLEPSEFCDNCKKNLNLK